MSQIYDEDRAHAEWVRRRKADPIRQAKKELRPDVEHDELSSDPLVAAFQRWDARPTDRDRVVVLQEELARLGVAVSPSALLDDVNLGRLSGLDLVAAVERLRRIRGVDIPVESGDNALR